MLDMNNPEDIEKFGEKIKEARKKSKDYNTLEKLAEEIGVKRSSISDWEKGKKIPSINHLTSLCNTLNIDLGYLLDIYDEDNAYIHSVSDITGLSEEASEVLCRPNDVTLKRFLDLLLTNSKLYELSADVGGYIESKYENISVSSSNKSFLEYYHPTASQIYKVSASDIFSKILDDMFMKNEKNNDQQEAMELFFNMLRNVKKYKEHEQNTSIDFNELSFDYKHNIYNEIVSECLSINADSLILFEEKGLRSIETDKERNNEIITINTYYSWIEILIKVYQSRIKSVQNDFPINNLPPQYIINNYHELSQKFQMIRLFYYDRKELAFKSTLELLNISK